MALSLLLIATTSLAQTPPPGSDDDAEMAELLAIVQQETEVATKTRMNSDYVPGIVTVLKGTELEALGIVTAGEALSLVPGMEAVRDARGNASVIVRGIDFPFNSGNIQIHVNGVPLTRADAGINASALLIPVELVERIEVIRGPGSVVYGDFAFMGLVNIITKKSGKRVAIRGESPHPGTNVIGLHEWKSGGTSVSASLSRFSNDDVQAPVTSPDSDDDRWFGIANVSRGHASLTAQTSRRTFSPPQAGLRFSETSWVVDGRYDRALLPKLRAEGRVSYLKSDITNTTTSFRGDLAKAGIDVLWSALPRQSWLLGADYSASTIDRATHRPPAPGGGPGPLLNLAQDTEREILGLTAQNRIDLSEDVAVTVGARYDSYSDFDDRVTPRASVVWRASERHIFKAQYAEGFRPPTFFELYTPPAPRSQPRYAFEVNATTEVNYLFRTANTAARATIFRSDISNMIRPGGILTDPNARAEGVELEYGRQINDSFKVDANVSRIDTIDPRVPAPGENPNPVSAQWLFNLALFYQPMRHLNIGTRWNHIGDRVGGAGFDIVDVTLSREDLLVAGLDVRVGVKNLLDSDISYLTARPTGEVGATVYPGRSMWLQFSWRR